MRQCVGCRELKPKKDMIRVIKKMCIRDRLKGMNLQEGATAMERNSQIGGHKA